MGNQAAKKVKRREARASKAVAIAPRPLAGALRPVVQCPTFRYNAKQRLGRGFTIEEVKGAGMSIGEAKSVGVAIDKRRRNKSTESMQKNIQRLKEYKQKLVVLPKNSAAVEQNMDRIIMPVDGIPAVALESRVITEAEKKHSVYFAFHMAKANVKYAGQRQKRQAAREAAAQEKAGRKK